MKIAVVTNDNHTISAHFGKARGYLVLTVEDGKVVGREPRDKSACSHSHGHGHDHSHDHSHDHGHSNVSLMQPGQTPPDPHNQAAALIADCEAVLSRGMGRGMFQNLQRAGVRPVLTDIASIEKAVEVYLSGSLVEHPELVH